MKHAKTVGSKVINLSNYNAKEVITGPKILSYIETLYNIYTSLDGKSVRSVVNSGFKKFGTSSNYLQTLDNV